MELDPRLHFVTATAIIVRPRSGTNDFEYLIAKRAATEKAYPNMWTVPGGKLVTSEYAKVPKTTKDAWYNIIEWLIKKEVMEEVNVEIGKPKYLVDLVFIRPDGYPVITLSYWCMYESGEAKPGKDLTEVAWVTAEEAKKYELIEGIWEEIEEVDEMLKKE